MCEYLEGPSDLESTALRDRFCGLEDQIESLMSEFDLIEKLVYQKPLVRTDAFQGWDFYQGDNAIAIETHTQHVEDIYATLIRFALDNNTAPGQGDKVMFTRNHSIFSNVRLSHFTSLLPSPSTSDEQPRQDTLSDQVTRRLVDHYSTCLLYGAMPAFAPLFSDILAQQDDQLLKLLLSSTLCYMLTHTSAWHPDLFASGKRLARAHYEAAKELLASLYFDEPNVITCHALCNMVLYHIESGHSTSLIYLYSGMAVRMGASLDLFRDLSIADGDVWFAGHPPDLVHQYVHSVSWLLYALDTAAAHFDNKPYQLPDDIVRPPAILHSEQGLFLSLEYTACSITRDIRRTCLDKDTERVPYREIERIERRLVAYREAIPPRTDGHDLWRERCHYMHHVRCHGLWILLHHTYLPTPVSSQRCDVAAFALVDLFDAWGIDCYFRPCVHELKQASEILELHVEHRTPREQEALAGLQRLINVVLDTPVHDIARTRPFIQHIQRIIS